MVAIAVSYVLRLTRILYKTLNHSFCRIPCLPIFVMASLAFALLGLPTLVAAAKPHVLFILADDYGWGNMGVHRRDAGSSPEEIQEKRKFTRQISMP